MNYNYCDTNCCSSDWNIGCAGLYGQWNFLDGCQSVSSCDVFMSDPC